MKNLQSYQEEINFYQSRLEHWMHLNNDVKSMEALRKLNYYQKIRSIYRINQ
jgi:hypothetical protein